MWFRICDMITAIQNEKKQFDFIPSHNCVIDITCVCDISVCEKRQSNEWDVSHTLYARTDMSHNTSISDILHITRVYQMVDITCVCDISVCVKRVNQMNETCCTHSLHAQICHITLVSTTYYMWHVSTCRTLCGVLRDMTLGRHACVTHLCMNTHNMWDTHAGVTYLCVKRHTFSYISRHELQWVTNYI